MPVQRQAPTIEKLRPPANDFKHSSIEWVCKLKEFNYDTEVSNDEIRERNKAVELLKVVN